MGIIMCELKRGDRVAAEKVFREWGNYLDGPQNIAMRNTFQVTSLQSMDHSPQGYDENDREQVEKGLSSTAVKELDLDFAKLAR